MGKPDFWDDTQKAQEVTREVSRLREPLQRYQQLEEGLAELEVHTELLSESLDEEMMQEAVELHRRLKEQLRAMQLEVLLKDKYDTSDCILSIHPGAGGTESQDWASMLMRMYMRWAEKRGFQVEVLDLLEGEEAGIKSATLSIRGAYAYGYLRAEKGVHRLVRISPFDASGRRHTSFASIDVMPDVPEEEIEIRPEDLRIDTYRASGAGGQHVNKTESAVRITHIPTGIVVQCQTERSQHSNRETAMKILRARLIKRREEEREKELQALRGEQGEIAWGNQIRSYVFQPYTLVKDHRTNFEVGNVQGVMDGEIDPFIYAYLEMKAAAEIKKS